MGLFNFLFGKKKITLDELKVKNQDYISKNPKPKNEENALMRQASRMLTSENFNESIELYKKLAENYPQKKGLYLSQIGAAFYFLNDFDKAIEYYLKAKNEGVDSYMIDNNIWETCKAIYYSTNDDKTIERYLEYYPHGNYAKKAKKILSKKQKKWGVFFNHKMQRV
ncbi:tetratricopeptide repeat protein [Flavivirga jejuensis]|uniref:Tetratricopeptide repeat protein n=1 Tax=Flavivirga jejuensis TaxID=870487 RepID=A0ABT8WLF8_9FLAO|nr:hypothetical protein [Flavivirga jejuensis]MDO5973943.1 hypothetical protein [Flavivirga jejuensis]